MAPACIDWLIGTCEILFPRECLVCTRPLRGRSLCFRCCPPAPTFTTIRCPRCYGPTLLADPQGATPPCTTCQTFPPPTREMRYLWDYSDRARDLIRTMKYQPSVYLTRYSAHVLTDNLPALFNHTSWDLIVPIPSSPRMVRKRLFHPCYEIAKVVSRTLPLARISYSLKHLRKRPPQATLSHAERLKGLAQLFYVKHPNRITGRNVLLVEDVITTGATIAAASHALYAAGASNVDVLALAQARVWKRFRGLLFRTLGGHGGGARTLNPTQHLIDAH